MNFFTLLYRLLKNDRLIEYRSIIRTALEYGYHVCSVRESLDVSETTRQLVLRHDVDYHSAATLGMAQIERQSGVRATYYFRWSTFDPGLIQQLDEMGHECSLHYETFAILADALNLRPNRDEVDAAIIDTCRQLLGREILIFRKRMAKHGCPIAAETIATHGAAANRAFNFPNNNLVTRELYDRWGIRLEVYDPDYLARFDEYISDAALNRSDGWCYGLSPCEAFQRGARAILFLSHPNHWHYNRRQLAVRLLASVVRCGGRKGRQKFAYEHLLRGGRS